MQNDCCPYKQRKIWTQRHADTKEMAVYKTYLRLPEARSEAWTEPFPGACRGSRDSPANTLIADFLSPELRQLISAVPPDLWYFVRAVLEN